MTYLIHRNKPFYGREPPYVSWVFLRNVHHSSTSEPSLRDYINMCTPLAAGPLGWAGSIIYINGPRNANAFGSGVCKRLVVGSRSHHGGLRSDTDDVSVPQSSLKTLFVCPLKCVQNILYWRFTLTEHCFLKTRNNENTIKYRYSLKLK